MGRSRIQIVKVQRPLFSTSISSGYLVYAKERMHAVEQDIPRDVRVALGENPKGYFKAIWKPSEGKWLLGTRVPDQDW